MFSFGFTEIAVICLLAVILFPPRELPKLARAVARVYGTIRRTADDFKSAILEDPDLNEPIDEIKSAYRKTRWEVRRAEDAARRELAKARMDARMAVRRRAPGAEDGPSGPSGLDAADADGAQDFDEDLDEDFDEDFDEDVDGRVGRGLPPLAVATDPEDDAGGDGPDQSQGAA